MRGTRLLAAVVVITLLPLGAWASLPTDPVTKDTVIDSPLSLAGESLFPEGNIIVVPGGDLTLTNCTLGMADGKRIEVQEGGNLTLEGTDIFCKDNGGSLGFACWGKLLMENCRLWHLGRFNSENTTLGGGLYLFSSDCTVLDSTFNCTNGYGICVEAGAPIIRGNRFSVPTFYEPYELIITRSQPLVENNTFTGNYDGHNDGGGLGVFIEDPAAPILANNSFCELNAGIEYDCAPDEMSRPVLEGNFLHGCRVGLMIYNSAGYMDPVPALQVLDDRFDSNGDGIWSWSGPQPIVDGCIFSNNSDGFFQQYTSGTVISNCSFSDNTQGIYSIHGNLHAFNIAFDKNNISLSSSETDMVLEDISINGSHDTGIHASNTGSGQCTVSNSTITNSTSMGIYIDGAATLFNDAISNCPFGVYRALRQYGHGQGRDSGQGPTQQPGMASIQQCLFTDNQRGIYTEGMTDITSNVFEGDGSAVEVSSFIPVQMPDGKQYEYNGIVDGLAIQSNVFANNTEGIMFLATNQNIHDDGGSRIVQHNDFVNNSIGIDLLQSDADVVSNDFTRNSGWAFRAITSESELGSNDFGKCDRVWTEKPLSAYVVEPPGGDWQAPLYEYVQSENAAVDIFDRNGETLFHSDRTNYGNPEPVFSPDGFPFYFINVTATKEFGDGSIYNSGPVIVAAAKAGVGCARETVDTDVVDSITLYLSPTPDIAVTNLSFSNVTPREQEVVAGSFSIENNDTFDPSHVSLKDVLVEVDLDGATSWIFTIPWLQSGRPERRNLTWTAVAGLHEWTVRADPLDLVCEPDKLNNVLSVQLDVDGRPHAILSAPGLEALPGEGLLFSGAGSTDDGVVSNYFFDFGDQNTSGWVDAAWVNHSFARSGAYEVRLKVRDALGFESDWSPALTVSIQDVPPSVAIFAERTVVLTLEQVNLTALPSDPAMTDLTVAWSFGDGGSIAGPGLFAMSHTYLKMGTYNVSVNVDDGQGGTAGACLCITVRDRPPVAGFFVSPPEGTVLTVFTFIPTASDEDGWLVSFSWDLGSGNHSTMERPEFSYPAPGTYNVSLVVTDDDGSVSAPSVRTVTVVDTPPVARARLVGAPVRAGKEVTFDASSSFDPEDRSPGFAWDFGDGATASGTVVKHSFTHPGTYTVKVTVSDRYGAESSTTLNVTVPAANEKAGSDALWTGAAWVAGMLLAAGVLFVLWTGKAFIDNGGKGPRRRGGRGVTRTPGYGNDHAGKLARSRQKIRSADGSRRDRRSLYDRMQPARNDKR